ncbi:hypothetical protein SAMN04488542_106131 [Fontibacillus panacisegetis]|uniref:Uncharacterized protein n=1 Tax=Fontibacillus panacisegetis TaxID=670482 RepID=A0A1G7ITN7_9BACL|nr:hypothetical protein SAMN04488542_106131 [Fontibacillus panacisegetis]
MTTKNSTKDFAFEDLTKISRVKLGNSVPLELYRAIRLIGMYQGLPLKGKGTTLTIGRKIGEELPVHSLEELLEMLRDLKVGFGIRGSVLKKQNVMLMGMSIANMRSGFKKYEMNSNSLFSL